MAWFLLWCESMGTASGARRFFFLLLIAATVLFGYVVQPIASALFLGMILAGVLWPAHRWLTRLLRGHRGLSAAAFVVGLILLVLGPTVAFSTVAITEGRRGVAYIRTIARSGNLSGLLDKLPPVIGKPAQHLLKSLPDENEGLTEDIRQKMAAQGGNAAVAIGATLSATGSLLFQAAMMLIAFYFLLLQGDQLVAWIFKTSPLKEGQTRELLTEFKSVSSAVILSTVLTSALQAVAALIGYFIARVPHALFFAGVTFVVAFVPAVGAGVVCLAVALLVFLTGHPYAALFLAIWALTVVSLVDNLVKPWLIRMGMGMDGVVVFFALVGGLSAFGAVGLLLGPLVVAFLASLLRIYRRDFQRQLDSGADSSAPEHGSSPLT